MEGPKAPSGARSTEGVGFGEERRSLSLVWVSGGIAPEKFSNLMRKSMQFHAIFALNITLNLMKSFP